jgi:hypothetical protein
VPIPAEQIFAIKENVAVDEAAGDYEARLKALPPSVLPRTSSGVLTERGSPFPPSPRAPRVVGDTAVSEKIVHCFNLGAPKDPLFSPSLRDFPLFFNLGSHF